ncbi:MAG: hypothetical protein AAFQ55_06780 [Pseudomonadota bacterium]
MRDTQFDIYKFKERLRDICGNDYQNIRAVEIIADACALMESEELGYLAISHTLYQAALSIAFDADDNMREYWHFARHVEESGKRAQKTVEEMYAKYNMGPPPSAADNEPY